MKRQALKEESSEHLKAVRREMYDLFRKGNYMKSFGNLKEMEAELNGLLRKTGTAKFDKSSYTAIKSVHFSSN